MAWVWQSFSFLLLISPCIWPTIESKGFPHLASLEKHYKSIFTTIKQGNSKIEQEYSQQKLQINAHGLPKCEQQTNPYRQIGIIGAAKNRAGGRIETYRERYKLNIIEFSGFDENAYTYINGIWATKKQERENPDIFQFNTSQNEREKTSNQLLSEALRSASQTFSEGGWSAVVKKWDSYSIESYLLTMNLSRAAINYIGIAANSETSLYASSLEFIRGRILPGSNATLYRISNGNDLLVQSMINDCQILKLNRCSILYSTPINQVRLLASNQIQLTGNNGMNQIFDTVVVATPSTVTQLFDFEPSTHFIQKYLALRQVHYLCSSKILLSFNVSW